MKLFFAKLTAYLFPIAFLCGFGYAQHCEYQELQAQYVQGQQDRERMVQEYERLKRQVARQQPATPDLAKPDKVVLAVLNRNPLNVKRANKPWQGQQGVDEHGHVIFASNEHGIRAAANVLMNYYHEHRIDTLQGIVDRFCTAPAKRKAQYARFIGKRLNIKPDRQFNVLERLPELLAAMARFESGHEYPKELFTPYSLIVTAYNKGGK